MSVETGGNHPKNTTDEIAEATKIILEKLHNSRIKSFDERIGNRPTEREQAEEALRIKMKMTELPKGKEGREKRKSAGDFLKRLQKSSAGRTLFNELSEKLILEKKEKQKNR